MTLFHSKQVLISLLIGATITAGSIASAQQQPLADVHIHYSHDAWEIYPPNEAVALLRKAGLKYAFVSSSSDDGTQMLYAEASDLIVPVLRPYRRRGELSTWMHDPTSLDNLRTRLSKNTYAGIGEFHAYGDDIETEVLRGVIALADKHNLFLHAHSDAEAIHLIFKQDPGARVLWAHSGFEDPGMVGEMLRTYPRLWSDLAFRSDQAYDGEVSADWRALFEEFPDRLMIGTDTYTPERWPYVTAHAEWTREWLNDLPTDLAEKIAWRNAEGLLKAR
jgi:hypothetical protein